MELNNYDITVLREWRMYLAKRKVLTKWKKNTLLRGYRGIVKHRHHMLSLAQLMFDRMGGTNEIKMPEYRRMLTIIGHYKATFSWAVSEEGFGFWADLFTEFKDYFVRKYKW